MIISVGTKEVFDKIRHIFLPWNKALAKQEQKKESLTR